MSASDPPSDRRQKFRDKNKHDLFQDVRVHQIGGEYYIYWDGIQQAFGDVDHLQKFLNKNDDICERGERVLYEVSEGNP